LTPGWMAKYAPGLNDIERDRKTLKARHLADKTFKTKDDLKIASTRTSRPSIQPENRIRWPKSESLLRRTPFATARSRSSPVRTRINSRSNSASTFRLF
ncbi:MAG: hypothetical protein ACR2KT_16900, partial [Methylocella sp.]